MYSYNLISNFYNYLPLLLNLDLLKEETKSISSRPTKMSLTIGFFVALYIIHNTVYYISLYVLMCIELLNWIIQQIALLENLSNFENSTMPPSQCQPQLFHSCIETLKQLKQFGLNISLLPLQQCKYLRADSNRFNTQLTL